MKILAFDTETGGLDPSNASLLTAYFEVVDENLNTLDSLFLHVKPDDGLFKANPQAMAVNKINLESHAKEALTYTEARIKLKSFIAKHGGKYESALIPLAHNIDFDLGFVNTHLLDKRTWESFVSYRKLDTANIANFLKLAGLLPEVSKFALGTVAKAIGVEYDDRAHTADYDVKVMLNVLREFKKRVNPNVA